jgi:hypothetical protein
MLLRFLIGSLILALLPAPVAGCDLCALYTSFAAREFRAGWSVGVFEQYADFGTVQEEGREIDDPAGQWVHSSATQLFVGYQWSRRFGVQVNLPWIDRAFRRLEGDEIERGSETGLGDVALLAHWQAYEWVRGTSTFHVLLLGGVKLPTGSTDRLAEELAEDEAGGEGAVHGHDLTLGSGSVDFVAGARLYATVGRAFFEGSAQYALRGTGDYDYRFADDLQSTLAGGGYVLLGHEHSLALGLQLAAERKGEDHLGGEALDDTAIDSLFAGPLARYTRGERWFAEAALDLPVTIDNSAVQIVPDWRLRLGVTCRF